MLSIFTILAQDIPAVGQPQFVSIDLVYDQQAQDKLRGTADTIDIYPRCLSTNMYVKHIQFINDANFARHSIPVCAIEGGVNPDNSDSVVPPYSRRAPYYKNGIKVGSCDLVDDFHGLLTVTRCYVNADLAPKHAETPSTPPQQQ